VGRDGNLYYLCGLSKAKPTDPGGFLIGRASPEGTLTVLNRGLEQMVEKLEGITGLATGPDGHLYAAFPSAVLRIATDGTASTLVHPIALADSDVDFPDGNPTFHSRLCEVSPWTTMGRSTPPRSAAIAF
jgi:hypothetical protein